VDPAKWELTVDGFVDNPIPSASLPSKV